MKRLSWRTWLMVVVGLFLAGIFVWSRLYRLSDSLLFFIDIGRDANVLLTWRETGRPPLLGPQTSALPFNQSAWYFYLLFPGFLLSGGSPFSSIFSTVFYYLAAWASLAWLSRRSKVLLGMLAITALLVIMHPQFVIQNRFVWNPSWVTPAVMIAVVGMLELWKKWSWQWLAAWAVASAAAVGFSYSVVPMVLASLVLAVWRWRWRAMWWVVGLGLSVVWFNLPTAFFEVRHHFPLTTMMVTQKKLAQTQKTIFLKTDDALRFGLEVPKPNQWAVAILVVVVIAGSLIFDTTLPAGNQRAQWLRVMTAWLVLTLLLTAVVPVSILSHYIFGFLTLFLVVVALLPQPMQLLVIGVCAFFWLQPTRLQSYVAPAIRTVAQMQRCFAKVCADNQQPLFVSVQAGFHPFHAAQEHRFLMRSAGCVVPEIDVQPQAADYMAVVVDNSEYTHGSTAYNELTQFGASLPVKQYHCQDNFQVVLLKRQ